MAEGDIPAILLHGTKDTTVPYQGSMKMDARANTTGVPHDFIHSRGRPRALGQHHGRERALLPPLVELPLRRSEPGGGRVSLCGKHRRVRDRELRGCVPVSLLRNFVEVL